MKPPLIITTQLLKEMVESFHESDFAKQKLESAKKTYERDKVQLHALLNANKGKK